MIETTRKGLVGILRYLDMLPGRPAVAPDQVVIRYARGDIRRIRLPWDAIVMPGGKAGDRYRKGEVIGTAVCLDDPRKVRTLKAPCDGILWNTGRAGVVHEGQPARHGLGRHPLC